MKIFEVRGSFPVDTDEPGETRNIELLVRAISRTEAVRKVTSHGYEASIDQCRVSMSHAMVALSKAGVITDTDLTLLITSDKSVAKVRIGEEGSRVSENIGRLHTGSDKYSTTEFVPLHR